MARRCEIEPGDAGSPVRTPRDIQVQVDRARSRRNAAIWKFLEKTGRYLWCRLRSRRP